MNAKKRELLDENCALKQQLHDAKVELDTMRAHWRPVPMMHEWQPRNSQCALCDDPRDAPRHQVDTQGGALTESWAEPEATPDDAPLSSEALALAEHFRYLGCGQVVDPVDLEDCAGMAEEVLRFLGARGWVALAPKATRGEARRAERG